MRIDCNKCGYYYSSDIELADPNSPISGAIGTNMIHKTEFLYYGDNIFECPVCGHRFEYRGYTEVAW